jgi:predicted RNA-binding Zn-ribbon protein involved in translation (DUF1610 family)
MKMISCDGLKKGKIMIIRCPHCITIFKTESDTVCPECGEYVIVKNCEALPETRRNLFDCALYEEDDMSDEETEKMLCALGISDSAIKYT